LEFGVQGSEFRVWGLGLTGPPRSRSVWRRAAGSSCVRGARANTWGFRSGSRFWDTGGRVWD